MKPPSFITNALKKKMLNMLGIRIPNNKSRRHLFKNSVPSKSVKTKTNFVVRKNILLKVEPDV